MYHIMVHLDSIPLPPPPHGQKVMYALTTQKKLKFDTTETYYTIGGSIATTLYYSVWLLVDLYVLTYQTNSTESS